MVQYFGSHFRLNKTTNINKQQNNHWHNVLVAVSSEKKSSTAMSASVTTEFTIPNSTIANPSASLAWYGGLMKPISRTAQTKYNHS